MVSMAEIYEALDEQDARLFVYHIGFSRAATIELDGQYAVFFDPNHVRSTAALKECLAHECGHCATGATHHLSSQWDLISRHEYKANRWAFERFLPFDQLREAIQGGLREPWQLAEFYDFPQTFIENALHYYTQTCGLRFWEESADAGA